jgi:predicted CopG family antitoxin
MSTQLTKFIRVKDETHKELSKLGTYGDSMDDIIRRLLEAQENE